MTLKDMEMRKYEFVNVIKNSVNIAIVILQYCFSKKRHRNRTRLNSFRKDFNVTELMLTKLWKKIYIIGLEFPTKTNSISDNSFKTKVFQQLNQFWEYIYTTNT